MNFNFKNYQEKAINQLLEILTKLISKDEKKRVIVFQAPTGSGKTLMTAKFIEESIKELDSIDFCFVWVSIGKGDLHYQSKKSLQNFFGEAPRVTLAEEEFSGGRERIVRNEVVVVNWEKLRAKDKTTSEWKNILMKDGEKLNFRDVLNKTREQRKIILIIDESHIGATADRTNELKDEIDADIIIEMSATPTISPDPKELARGEAGYIFVEPKDVIEEGMIKKELIINENISEIKESEIDSQEIILEAAFQKRLLLKQFYEQENSQINPLVLIQIPTAESGDEKLKFIYEFFGKKDIYENRNDKNKGKLAIWLSEQKSDDLDSISKIGSEIDFLVFKQAIDTGWDCPRAQILVKFRELSSETFEIQTVGRILRMPEQKHYINEGLNKAYIFTNVQSVLVKKENYNPNIIKHLRSERKSLYSEIKLESYYKSRADYGDITSSFSEVFDLTACDYFEIDFKTFDYNENVTKLERKGVQLNQKKFRQEIISDAKIESEFFDEMIGDIDSKVHANLAISGNDLQNIFDNSIKECLGSFTSIKRSIPIVKTAIYMWFRNYIGSKNWNNEFLYIQTIFVNNSNKKLFLQILNSAIEKYKLSRDKEISQRIIESQQWYQFEIPTDSYFNQYTDELVQFKKYIHQPCYLALDRSNPERNFEKFLAENDNKIEWWWKNGVSKKDYFGLKYEYPKNVINTFYPDYLIKFTNGKLGIFETKDSNDREGATSTKMKAEALQLYIANQNNKDLVGGILIERKDGWKINDKSIYNWNDTLNNNWSDWIEFSFF